MNEKHQMQTKSRTESLTRSTLGWVGMRLDLSQQIPDQRQNPLSGNAPTAAVGDGCCILHISDITLYRGERLQPIVRTTCAITVGVARPLP